MDQQASGAVVDVLEGLKAPAFLLQDVDASEIKVQVCVYAFDLLYLNGQVRRLHLLLLQLSFQHHLTDARKPQ